MRCPQCSTDNPDQAKFCMNCGASLAVTCPQCRSTLPPQTRFCTECGSQVTASPPPDAAAPAFLTERLQRMVPQEYAERLLATRGQVAGERRLVTILFCDVKGSTALAESLDPEDVMEIMNSAFDHLIGPVARHDGTLARLMGDAVLAFFGAPLSHEDDARRAVDAALEIVTGARQYAAHLERERGLTGFDVRVGINTGLVVVGEVGSDLRVEYTAMGDAINLAARLEQHAPPGGILISHDTYQHVRGAFEVVAQEPLAVKGKAEPVQTYLVERARPRAFRDRTRGVEGVETPLIGREAEMLHLQEAWRGVVKDGASQVVTLVGEAGVGKSRLLYEFDRWAQAQPGPLSTFRGRVSQEMQNVPYALLRDLFSAHFQIQDSDPGAVARDKLVRGLTTGFQKAELEAQGNAEMKAHIVGQLLGFDFSTSPHVQAIGDDAQQLRDRALVYVSEYFRALAAQHPVLILLEDLHWADGSSLNAVGRLAASLSVGTAGPSPALIVCAARPSLYQRRPEWGEGRAFHSRLDLSPLSTENSHRLVDEILRRVAAVPARLRDLVVTGAEGNPFFLEELIKMLIEEGVIQKSQTAWSVDAERLGDLHVPPTLTGVLQARLDRLPFEQRLVLQQASVVGRLFWDLAVAHLAAEAPTEPDFDQIRAALAALGGREMVFPRATSAFQGAHEYLFKHALLREVTYEGVLKRVRCIYHGLAADWLLQQTGDRTGEHTGLIADHLARAGRNEEAVTYLRRAAERAEAGYANAEAIAQLRRALALMPAGDQATDPVRAQLYEQMADLLALGGKYEEARQAYQTAIRYTPEAERVRRSHLACEVANTWRSMHRHKEAGSAYDVAMQQLGAQPAESSSAWWQAWLEIQLARADMLYFQSELTELASLCREMEPIATTHGSARQQSDYYHTLTMLDNRLTRFRPSAQTVARGRRALDMAREDGDPRLIDYKRFSLGFSLLWRGDLESSETHLAQALTHAKRRGEIDLQDRCLAYLSINYRLAGNLDQARRHTEQGWEVAFIEGNPFYIGVAMANLAWLSYRAGNLDDATRDGTTALQRWSPLPFPFEWLARWPLLAAFVGQGQTNQAMDQAQAMLDPAQQRLHDALVEPLEKAAAAWAEKRPSAARDHLLQAVRLARESGHL